MIYLILPAMSIFLFPYLGLYEPIEFFISGRFILVFNLIASILLTLVLYIFRKRLSPKLITLTSLSVLFYLFLALQFKHQDWPLLFCLLPFLLWKYFNKRKCQQLTYLLILSFTAEAIYKISFKEEQKLKEFFVQSEKKELENLPNIYHFIFDQGSSDYALEYFSKKEMNGFTFYKNVLANYAFTIGSISSTFLGQYHQEKSDPSTFFSKSFSLESGLLPHLKTLGYHLSMNTSLTPMHFADSKLNFVDHDYDFFSKKDKNLNTLNTYAQLYYRKLFPFRNRYFLSPNLYRMRSAKEILGFKKFIEIEETLSARGRYTFIYISSPHYPFVTDKNCHIERVIKWGSYESSYHCVLSLLEKFTEELKRIGRYDNSIILAHSDHGRNKNDRHHPFLLLKTLSKDNDKFKVDNTPLELIDIPLTLLNLAIANDTKHRNMKSEEFKGQDFLSKKFQFKESRSFYNIYPFAHDYSKRQLEFYDQELQKVNSKETSMKNL